MAKGICSIEGCERYSDRLARGWCPAHYQRWLKHGDPFGGGAPSNRGLPVEERFWAKVDKDGPVPDYAPHLGPCWIWTAGLSTDGYGHIWADNYEKAHRFAFEMHAGPIPVGMELDHLCRVRACVNPAHLEPVTHQENARRGQAAKTHCPHGHRLSEDNIYRDHRGSRCCLTCTRQQGRENTRRYRAKKRESA
jgi:hypothetical protein